MKFKVSTYYAKTKEWEIRPEVIKNLPNSFETREDAEDAIRRLRNVAYYPVHAKVIEA